MALFDTILAKNGKLRVVIRTKKGVVIKVNPKIRLPRTYKRFSGLMAQLLTKMKIKSPENSETLLEVVNGKIESMLPYKARVVSTSSKGHLVCDLQEYIQQNSSHCSVGTSNDPLVFVVGCSSHGDKAHGLSYPTDCISISNYQLSAQSVCQRVCFGYEEVIKVVF